MDGENAEVKALIAEVGDLQKKLVELDPKQIKELAYLVQLLIMGEGPADKRMYH